MTNTNAIAYLADSILINGRAYPVRYCQDAETSAMILGVDLGDRTVTITLHTDHEDYASAAEAMRQQDAQSPETIPTYAEARSEWEAERADELAQKQEARAAFLAAKQARKEAKPLPEWAGQSIEGNGFAIRFDAFYRDTMVVFEGVPLPAVRELVKASGFWWAPTKGAWVRGLSAKSKRAAEELAPKLASMQIYSRNASHRRAAR